MLFVEPMINLTSLWVDPIAAFPSWSLVLREKDENHGVIALSKTSPPQTFARRPARMDRSDDACVSSITFIPPTYQYAYFHEIRRDTREARILANGNEMLHMSIPLYDFRSDTGLSRSPSWLDNLLCLCFLWATSTNTLPVEKDDQAVACSRKADKKSGPVYNILQCSLQ